ncbi:MAG TPA: glutamine synthetase, partial [Rubrivivax sp.]|nr:glutamine synthetase [Rubrivivax sp.]
RWGRDNRGAMLRVLGGAGDPATRIENRVGEPMANPYLYIASQVHAGLNGVEAGLRPAAATRDPYDMAGNESTGDALPASLDEALAALQADTLL